MIQWKDIIMNVCHDGMIKSNFMMHNDSIEREYT